MELEMIKVISSNIEAIGYLENEEKMIVEFKGGSLYEYYNVNLDEFNEVLSANSVGSTFNNVIKKHKLYNKI